MKNLLYPLVFATAFVATACTSTQSPDIDTPVDPNGKTPISFVGQSSNHPITRAGFTDQTQIVMHIRSNKNGGAGTDVRETRTVATAAIDTDPTETSTSSVSQLDSYLRYWDDAYGRDAQLSVFAIAVPGKTNTDNTFENKLTKASDDKTWATTALSEDVAWSVSADQSGTTTISDQDLVYSNNIQGDKKLKFTSGKFDQGKLEFKHALSRMTVNLKKGEGYSTKGAFDFAAGTNVKVLGVPTSGTLNIETGAWAANPTSSDITKMAETTAASGVTYSLMAQMLPGYTFTDGTNTNVLEFTIDDNKYFVTQDMMFDALPDTEKTSGSPLTMAQGKNYVFTITVGKSKIINVSAKLENFVNVDATNLNMDNSHISLNLFDSTNGSASTSFDLYRLNDPSAAISTGASTATNWKGNYTEANKASLTKNSNGSWDTGWFFEDNKSFYHFRTVNKNTEIKENTTDQDDYFVITSGPVASTDPHWGAPFVKNADIKYNTEKGYAAIISPAIGATNSTISMTELHMMSNIKVLLQTTDGADKVTLTGAKVYITKFHNNAHVLMGTGLVTPTNDITNTQEITSTDASTGTEFTYAVVPQTLIREENPSDDDYVGIIIEAGDNQYIVKKLSDITVNGESDKITYWHPNHSYTYTFTLTKTGIDKLTCTVSNWVNVTADNKNISLED